MDVATAAVRNTIIMYQSQNRSPLSLWRQRGRCMALPEQTRSASYVHCIISNSPSGQPWLHAASNTMLLLGTQSLIPNPFLIYGFYCTVNVILIHRCVNKYEALRSSTRSRTYLCTAARDGRNRDHSGTNTSPACSDMTWRQGTHAPRIRQRLMETQAEAETKTNGWIARYARWHQICNYINTPI